MTSLKSSQLPTSCYLRELHVVDVVDGRIDSTGDSRVDALVMASANGEPGVCTDPRHLPARSVAVMTVPVYRGDEVASVVAMVAKADSKEHGSTAGVFEIWKHTPPYEELALAAGAYGAMERFAGVSRFVRFERGNGLPGQVWDQNLPVVHDDLTNHPGFLRAAGASAEILRTAVGLPITTGSGSLVAAVLLISSTISPIARGFEVWRSDDDGFELTTAAYHDFGEDFTLPIGSRATETSLAVTTAVHGTALLTEDPEALMAGRQAGNSAPGPTSALAIPFYEDDAIRSVATLLF